MLQRLIIISFSLLIFACTPIKQIPVHNSSVINSNCYEFLSQDSISLAWSCFNLVQDLGRLDLAAQGRATVLLLKQKYSEAKHEFQRSLEFGNLLALYGLAVCNQKLGLITEAKLNYWQLISEFKEASIAHHNFGLFLRQYGNSKQEAELAREFLVRAKILNHDPNLNEYYKQLLSDLDQS
jgi:tetratricopeptide (TPR) repeat protein